MSRETALLTFGIGPVHTFIAQARRVADVWAGSYLLSHLIRQAIGVVHRDRDCRMVFPSIPHGEPIPDGLPNRFVARVPLSRADEISQTMRERVLEVWQGVCVGAIEILKSYPLWDERREQEWKGQTDHLLDFSWSWVPEDGDYAGASLRGARQYAAVRRFRPFSQTEEDGEKCAICGERTALPDGDRENIRKAWQEAERLAEQRGEAKYFRFDQGRLCLVCSTKRLFPSIERHGANFEALDQFEPSPEAPYLALVKVDGDHMGDILSFGPEFVAGGDLERFHREVSAALTRFAERLRVQDSAALNLAELDGYKPKGRSPQLIYAGGDDALLVCDPRDAFELALRLRKRYQAAFEPARRLVARDEDRKRFTLSGAILFAHSGHPAGLLLRDLENLLKLQAKAAAGRDALALRLMKRSGTPVNIASRWDEGLAGEGTESWIEVLHQIIEMLGQGDLSSHQTFTLRTEERTLTGVFTEREQWQSWLADRLSRNEATAGQAQELAQRIAPFFLRGQAEALRIARFLGKEVER